MGGLQKLQTVHFLMPSFCLGGKVMKERTKATGTDKKGVCWSTLNPLVLTKGALLYGVIPVCALYETEHHGQLNVRAVLRHYVPNTGLHPLHRYAAILT